MILQGLLGNHSFDVIDMHVPFYQTGRLLRSFGFRYKAGPLIRRMNNYILEIAEKKYDLIWIDKAVFITGKTSAKLREFSDKLIHFTPDPAFTFHKSSHFRNSLKYYDHVITTKRYEQDYYRKYIDDEKLILTTQGYDRELHRPTLTFEEKKPGIVYIGHNEKNHSAYIDTLIYGNIHVCIAGRGWDKLHRKFRNNKYLKYLGDGVYGKDYVDILNEYQFGLGFLSKWIPELHTTRTFEIPACGTALLTEANEETRSFFTDEEAIFYENPEELVAKIKYYKEHPDELKKLSEAGMQRVQKDGRDYESILREILVKTGVLESGS